jgi:hypothetical protein
MSPNSQVVPGGPPGNLIFSRSIARFADSQVSDPHATPPRA